MRRALRPASPHQSAWRDADDPAATGISLRPGASAPLRRLTDRRLVRQHRWRLAGFAAALVLVAATVRTLWAAEDARAAWAASSAVIVATSDLEPGTTLDERDLAVVGLPAALVPPGATTGDPASLVGATVTRMILAGEPIATARLGPAGLGPTAARLAPGWRAVTLPLGSARPPLVPGDRVELVAVGGGRGSGASAVVVSRSAEVLELEADALTVAVPTSEVTAVVGAMAAGLITPVLMGA